MSVHDMGGFFGEIPIVHTPELSGVPFAFLVSGDRETSAWPFVEIAELVQKRDEGEPIDEERLKELMRGVVVIKP